MKRLGLMPGRSRKGMSTAQRAVLGGALALVAAPAIRVIASALRSRLVNRSEAQRHDAAIDKTLKDTFPASDPPSSNYFDIPVNRQ